MTRRHALARVIAGMVLAAAGCDAPRAPSGRRGEAVPAATAQDGGRVLFEETCSACHGRSGGGLPGRGPSLHGSGLVAAPPDVLVRIVLDGIRPDAAPSASYVLPMPSWRVIGDSELAALVTYVRAVFGGKGGTVSPGDVSRVRRETADRNRPWSRDELRAIVSRERP